MGGTGEILPRLLKLPVSERARLAAGLVQSLDEAEDADAAEAWLRELERRAKEAAAGTAAFEEWPDVRRRIEARLRMRRRA